MQPSADFRAPLTTEYDPLQPLLARLHITTFDLLLIGDGSGNAWDKACGWSGILIDRQTRGRRVCYGAVNQGSISFAETIPYLQLLSWFDQHYGKERLQSRVVLNVHIVTDSQVVANWGTAAMSPSAPIPRKQCVFWAAMRHLRSLGYVCTFHWAPRLSTELNWMADMIAGLARVAMIDLPGTQAVDSMTLGQRAATAISNLDFKSPDGNPLDVYTLH